MRWTVLIIKVVVLPILEDRLRGDREALAQRRISIRDSSCYVRDDVCFAVLNIALDVRVQRARQREVRTLTAFFRKVSYSFSTLSMCSCGILNNVVRLTYVLGIVEMSLRVEG